MPIYYNSRGIKVELTTELGKGGEGSVFSLAGDVNTVGKIYHKPPSSDKSEKINWMATNNNEQLLKVAAWVIDTLYDKPNGKLVGFLMPAIKAKEVHELYSPKSRRTHFPEADWRFLIHTAINLARAFNNVHEAGHVIGDVNHGNCVVLPDGIVKLIDCDSYSIQANGKSYQCEVGVTTHIAPELQGKSLRGTIRTQQHDNFGLAVIIFQILFLGRHPFSGKPLGKDEKTIEDCIQEQRFAYGSGASSRQIKQPPGTLNLEEVSLPVAQLFERAFLRYDRPTPREWIHALGELSKNLTRCKQFTGHHFWKFLKDCPWCRIEKQTGLPLFPINYQQQGQVNGFNILTIEQMLNSIQIPSDLSSKPVTVNSLPPPDPKLVEINKKNNGKVLTFLAIELLLVIVAPFILGFVGTLICGLTMAIVIYYLIKNPDTEAKTKIIENYNESRRNWLSFEKEWQLKESSGKWFQESAEIKTKINEYKNLDKLRLQKLKQLDEHLYDRQLEDYLDRFYIENGDIKGIGMSRAVTLQSYGIVTAADINKFVILSIPGFGPTYTQKLVMWQEGLKARFVFNPQKGVNPVDKQKVETEIITARISLEKLLQQKTVQLRAQAVNINNRNQYLLKKSQELSKSLAQAESDKSVFTSLSWIPVAAFLIASVIPLGGLTVQFISNLPPAPIAKNSPPPTNQLSNIINTTVNVSNSQMEVNSSIVVDTQNKNSNLSELANVDINSLTTSERQEKAETFFKQGVDLTKANSYLKAESFYKLAIKFDDTKPAYFHELGYAQYRLKKYKDSISSLQKSISLSSANEETKKILGLNFIEMKNWKEAQDLYSEISLRDNSFPVSFNLGIAAKNNGNYQKAIAALKKAVETEPNNTKAHYELGISCHKFGIDYCAEQEYQNLYRLDPKLAEKLGQEIYGQ